MPKSSEGGERDPKDIPTRRPPARSQKRRAQQIGVLAQDLLEERLRTGKASPTEVVAAIRLVNEAELANIERIKAQTEYLIAQKAKAEAETVRDEMFDNAIAAMGRYRGLEAPQ